MPPNPKLAVPFLTREMLSFENGVAFELQLEIYSYQAHEVRIIGATREGTFTYKFITAGAGTKETQKFRIPDVPIFITLATEDTTVPRGEIYAVIYLAAGGSKLWKLLSGYLSFATAISWPANPSENELLGRNKTLADISSDPAAGAEIAYTPSPTYIMVLKAMRLTLVTDANVANRRVNIHIPVSGNSQKIKITAPIDQTAGTTKIYHFAPYPVLPVTSEGSDIFVAIPPDIMVWGPNTIATITTNIQVGDNYSSLRLFFEPLFNI